MALTGCHISVVTQLRIFFGTLSLFTLLFWTFLSNISHVPTQQICEMKLFLILYYRGWSLLGVFFFLLLCTVFGNGILRNLRKKTSSDIAPMWARPISGKLNYLSPLSIYISGSMTWAWGWCNFSTQAKLSCYALLYLYKKERYRPCAPMFRSLLQVHKLQQCHRWCFQLSSLTFLGMIHASMEQ